MLPAPPSSQLSHLILVRCGVDRGASHIRYEDDTAVSVTILISFERGPRTDKVQIGRPIMAYTAG